MYCMINLMQLCAQIIIDLDTLIKELMSNF